MNQASLLKELYCPSSFPLTPVKAVIESFFYGNILEERLIAKALHSNFSTPSSPQAVLDKWRDLLALILALRAKKCLNSFLPQLLRYFRNLLQATIWHEQQLFAIYRMIVSFLLGQKGKEFSLFQLPTGVCPLEVGGYSAAGEIPDPLYHTEIGILCCLYGDLTNQLQYIEAACKLAEWQRNTLDHHYVSLVGLFSSEGETSEWKLLVANFLLFNAVARTKNLSEMAFLAEKQLQRLSQLAKEESVNISCYELIFEGYFGEKQIPVVSGEYYLPSIFHDENFALVGSRSSESSAAATLYGGKSGMGCYHYKDVKMISFGPQHLPLEDCGGFGLDGDRHFLSEYIKTLSTATGEYVVEGISRLPSSVNRHSLEPLLHGGWVSTHQEFKNAVLSINAKFQGVFDQNDRVFSFFVKCIHCIVDEDKIIQRRSLKRHSGKSSLIKLQGKDSFLNLHAGQNHAEMHVIPLGGGENFWGADFLIAYKLDENMESYSWQCSPH